MPKGKRRKEKKQNRKTEKDLRTTSPIHPHFLNKVHENQQPRNDIGTLSMLTSFWKSFSSQEITKAWESGLQSSAALTRAWQKTVTSNQVPAAPASSMVCNYSTCGIKRLLTFQTPIFLKHLNGLQTQNLHIFFRNIIWHRGHERVWSGTDFQTQSVCCWPKIGLSPCSASTTTTQH